MRLVIEVVLSLQPQTLEPEIQTLIQARQLLLEIPAPKPRILNLFNLRMEEEWSGSSSSSDRGVTFLGNTACLTEALYALLKCGK